MKRRKVLVIGLVLLLIVSCGCTGGASPSKMTPSEVVESYAKNHYYGDYEDMYVLMSSSYRNSTKLDEFRRKVKRYDYAFSSNGINIDFTEAIEEDIEGDKCTVKYEYDLVMGAGVFPKTNTVTLIKESDGWKLESTDKYL